MDVWFYVGIALILWAVYDLFTGKVLLHRTIYREYEPIFYWSVWLVWMVIGIIVLLGSL